MLYKTENGVAVYNTYYAHDLNDKIPEAQGTHAGYVVSYQVPVEKNEFAYVRPTWVTLDGVTISQNLVQYHVSEDGKNVSWQKQ